jgi:hypothetical protein
MHHAISMQALYLSSSDPRNQRFYLRFGFSEVNGRSFVLL